MAVSQETHEANYQKLLDEGVPESYIQGQKDYWQNKINPGEYNKILTGFKSTGNPYSEDNVMAATTQPVQKPDFSDPLGMRTRIQEDLGIPGLKDEVTGAKEALSTFDTKTMEKGLEVDQRLVSLSKLTGIKDAAIKQRAIGRISLAKELEAKADLLAASLGEATTRFDIQMGMRSDLQNLMLQAPGAGITFTDSFENALDKIEKYRAKQEKEARKQAEKDAFDALYMQTFGTDRGKLSRREARKKLEKKLKKEGEYEEEMKRLDLAIKKATLSGKNRGSAPKNSIQGEIMNLRDKGVSWGDAAAQMERKYGMMPGDEMSRVMDYVYGGITQKEDVEPYTYSDINTSGKVTALAYEFKDDNIPVEEFIGFAERLGAEDEHIDQATKKVYY